MSDTADKQRPDLSRDLLRQVSRSFYLSLKWLPAQVREPINLAYLLARTSDTIADTRWIPAQQRLAALQSFAGRVAGTNTDPVDFKELSAGQGDVAEGALLARAEESVRRLVHLSELDRHLVRKVLATIISGQTLDLKRFADASESNIEALESASDLEDYTYRVAGCVGEFWTQVCFAHLQPRCNLSQPEMVELGIRYGKGLQLVNILRDLPRDLRQGRCYLPLGQLKRVDLTPPDLLRPDREPRLRSVYNLWFTRARTLLGEGWTYTNEYPRNLARVRISCALPVLIGWRTLNRLRDGPILDPDTRIKVSRREVRQLVVQTIVRHPFESLWQRLASRSR